MAGGLWTPSVCVSHRCLRPCSAPEYGKPVLVTNTVHISYTQTKARNFQNYPRYWAPGSYFTTRLPMTLKYAPDNFFAGTTENIYPIEDNSFFFFGTAQIYEIYGSRFWLKTFDIGRTGEPENGLGRWRTRAHGRWRLSSVTRRVRFQTYK